MKRLSVLAVSLFMVSGSVVAAMYKCDDPATGKPTYSQTPCAPDAQVMELNIHRPTPEQIRQHEAQVESERKFIEESRARRKASQGQPKSSTAAEPSRNIPPLPQSGKPADS
ncbi:DUF4124 domain-containing protein [Thiorhodococcus fuscus]|uniref:DUF4124 domain-containing protein n=1 Tax=Thiorhodococcus fuscus TaxID=527200 RepID=A0ABW4YCU9_9GAMM